MNKERLEKIKENVYTRCSIATQTGIGLTSPDKEELELIDEIERLNNNWNELESWLKANKEFYPGNILFREVLKRMKEIKELNIIEYNF